jgi:hypothetical protein
MEPVSRSGTVMSGRQTPGVGPSPVDSYGRRTPAEQNNPYFPPSSDYTVRSSSAALPRSNTPGNASMRSYTPGAPPSVRSITPSTSYGRPYTPGQPPLPPLYTNTSAGSGGYQGYSAGSQSPAQSSFTPHSPYRSYTQPNMAMSSPDTPQSGYTGQQASRHTPPAQRPGTAPPTNRQNTPVADDVMEDIMNGY